MRQELCVNFMSPKAWRPPTVMLSAPGKAELKVPRVHLHHFIAHSEADY